MLKPIVVPLDGSALAEHALVPAVTSAKRLNTGLHLIRVRESDSADHRGDANAMEWDDAYLHDLSARLDPEISGDLLTVKELQGPVSNTVIAYAHDVGARMIVMA